jgi:hypothetical protein
MSLKDKLYWNGTTLAITGDLKITGSSTTLTETNTLNTNTTATDVGLGSVQDLDAQDQAQTGLIAGTTITGGGITLSSGGNIKGGQSAYNSGTGFFLGYESSQYKFSIGNQTNRLTWDGSTMTVQGDITATSGTFTGTVNANAGTFTGITVNTGTIGGWTATNVANRSTTSDLVTTGGSGNLLYTTYIWLDSTNGQIVLRD